MSSSSAGEELNHPIDDPNISIREDLANDIPVGATCRICRGEATIENPLFHPCKCKGSIKYLHEPCLLEWISARNLDVNKPGSVIKCDICHYPFQFKTKYAENMPERIPVFELIKNTFLNVFSKIYSSLLITIAGNLLVFGIPLIWNFFGRCYTFMLDGQLPYKGQFWKSVLLGYREKYLNNAEQFDYSLSSFAITILENAKFSAIQIALVAILHLALYFQYDMIVREDVFSKMVFHKIGPNFSIEEMKNRLKASFPAMEDEMLDQVATMMRDREKREHELRLDEEERAYNQQFDMPQEDVATNEQDVNENITNGPAVNNTEVPNDDEHHDPDYVLPEDHTANFNSDSDDNTLDFENHPVEQDELDDLREERERAVRNIAEGAEENQNENNFAEPLVRPVRPPQPAQPAPAAAQNANENIDAQEIINELQGNQNNMEQVAPFLINVNLKPTTVCIYTVAAIAVMSAYLFIAYYIPTLVGYVLISIYFRIIGVFIHGLVSLIYLSNAHKFVNMLMEKIPYSVAAVSWLSKNVIQPIAAFYKGYKDNTLQTSLFIRSLPALTTYLTAVTLVCVAAGYLCKDYSRRNGMTNSLRRLIFEILFAIRSTFKVFTLFFIELAGFPITAGVMLDLSLIAPVLGDSSTWLWVPKMCWVWTKGSLIVYWIVGTLYMYWFAKYIGMIRQYIIRPGVLFFIRSPDDPNIKILHDSLIHPMGIQLSRLCLSMFIYAVFILAGFGIHTRLIFPLFFTNNFISTYELFSTVNFINVSTMLLCFYLAKIIIEDNRNVIVLVRKYWMKMFQVISRKSRLSSFILGKDYSLERGHILYRNYFYKFFAPKTAQWSNPDLFTNPKTEADAKKLFQENNMIHAYFIPDGMLMRVPSSDIVSRNYVQTMFVPVTKNDKLLKPLDLKKMKERNQRNAGEFAYLDHQNTEFDDYFVCYVPPNFKLRYMSLIGLTWLFASLLIIGVAVASQYTLNTLTIIALPVLWILGRKNDFDSFTDVIIANYKNASLQYVCLGAIVLCSFIDYYKKHELSRYFSREHTVDPNEEHIEAHDAVEQAAPAQNQRGALNIILESWVVRMTVAGVAVIISRVVNILYAFLGIYLFLFSIGYWILQLNKYVAITSYSKFCFDQVKVIDFGIQYLSMIAIAYFILDTKPTAVGRLAYQPLRSIVTIVWKSRLRSGLRSVLLLGCFLVLNMGGFVLSEYYCNRDTFTSITDASSFVTLQNFKENSFITTPTTKLHFTIMTIVNSIVVLRYLVVALKSWFGEATQTVKDQVYASGRSLENYGLDN
ncbi:ERAD-associated E3 ubiquitin-protein ligase DOA10 [Monosporozyma unispora]|nr:hypothetical protein C6P44_001113 [Kazachstania unispora]